MPLFSDFQTRTLYASAARTASPTAMADQANRKHRGVRVTIVVTAATGSPSVVFTLQGKDAAGNYYTVLASAAVTGTGTTILTVFPGSAVAANASANAYLPGTWRVIAAHTGVDSITYSASAELLP